MTMVLKIYRILKKKKLDNTYLIIQGTKMERLYAELSEYYVFDKAKYTLEEFFGDIKTFKDQFKQVIF